MSSLLTQSLKRLAEVQSRQQQESRRADPPIQAAPAISENARKDDAAAPSPRATPDELSVGRRLRPARPAAPPRAEEVARPQSQNVPRHLADLCAAIFNDVGQPAAGEAGKVVVLVSVQADRDTKAASKALSTALLSVCDGAILSVDAAGAAMSTSKKSPGVKLHGFSSLIDGTRAVEDVIVEAVAPGVAIIPAGLDKGADQAVDPAAIKRAVADCRSRFAFTVVHGGPWQNENLTGVAQSADAVYLVIRANVTEQETAKLALKRLDRPGVHVRGCILAGALSA
jgi:Mrp family chromosome partitioning ATPase